MPGASGGTTADLDVDLGRLFGGLLRRWKRVLGISVAAGGLAFVLASAATPQFRGETRLLIEPRESQFTRPNQGGEGNSPLLDEEGITSQVEVIGSPDILKKVAAELRLAEQPEFVDEVTPSWAAELMVLAGLRSDPAEIPSEERVLDAFREKLQIYRVEKSRVIVVQFSSEDPKLAADVPNEIADEYIAVQRKAKLESNADATAWLEPEIAGLTQRVKEAEARVAAFRAQSDLLVGQNNAVLATQQLSELSSELSRVRAARGAAEASAASVRAALKRGVGLDSFPDVLSSDLIQRLRERQVQLKADIADLSTTLLDEHPRIRALRSQLADLDRQIRVEGENVLQSLATEAETAKLREEQLVSELNTLKAASARAGEEEVELRALEREAAAQRELLESYLSRYREAASRRDGNYLPVDARVFRGDPPAEPYFPKVLPITVAAFVAALILSAIGVLLAELFSGRAMRPARSSEAIPEAEMPETVPVVAAEPVTSVEPAAADAASPAPVVETAVPAELAAQPLLAVAASAGRELGIVRAAEALIVGRASRAIFVSPEGDEAAGAAVLVAREVADSGLRVLLLDLTASGAASLPMLDSGGYPGITNLLVAEAQFADIIRADHYSDCQVIPVGTANPARAMRAADRLPIIMDSLTTAYDLVVVECGPIDPAGIERLMADGAVVMMSVLDSSSPTVAAAADAFEAAGVEVVTVTPVGYAALGRAGHSSAA